jgi:hypothetical protein
VYRGPWPKISIWHGSADPIVKPSNAEANIRQWLDIHGLSELPSYEEKVGRHIRRVWNDTGGNILVEAYSISGMAHGVPLGTTLDGDICGTVGPFFLEAGLSSTQRIAESWQLDDNVPLTAQAPTMMFEAAQRRGEAGAVLLPGRDGSTAAAASLDLDRGQTESDPYGASATIAAAFEAAGLPVPAFRDASYVDPAPIIEAALKAAGLTP